MNGEYVIVPFDALQVSFDERQRTNLLTLGVTLDNLQRAPRLAVNRWSSLRDRQFFTGAKQFYQRIERTAARPQIGGVPEGAKPGEGGITPQPSNGQLPAPTPPRSEPPAANEPDTMKEPRLDTAERTVFRQQSGERAPTGGQAAAAGTGAAGQVAGNCSPKIEPGAEEVGIQPR